MAKIELINISKTFAGDKTISFWKALFPGLNLPGSYGKSESTMTGRAAKKPFSIQNLNLTIPDGKIMVILGPSGCGKTTILKIIAGLIKPDSGRIRYDGINMVDIPPGERQIGMVFQNYALYPHLTSKTNILSYFYFKKKTPELSKHAEEKFQRTSELLGVDIDYLLDRKPTHLSAGEMQRVALGRCITRDPVVFLLDEPFSNLDQKLREKYRVNLRILLKRFNITTVYVTHDQQEALILADYLAIMDIGRMEQVGTYEDIYNRPKNIFVADFLNLDIDTPAINLIEGGLLSQEYQEMTIGVRPENFEINEEETEGHISGIITNIFNLPIKNVTILSAKAGEGEIYTRVPYHKGFSTSQRIWLKPKHFHLFDRNSGIRIRSQ